MHRCYFSEEQKKKKKKEKNERRVLRVCECVCVFLCVLGVNETEKIAVYNCVWTYVHCSRSSAGHKSKMKMRHPKKKECKIKQLRITCLIFFLSFPFLLFPNTRLIHTTATRYTHERRAGCREVTTEKGTFICIYHIRGGGVFKTS